MSLDSLRGMDATNLSVGNPARLKRLSAHRANVHSSGVNAISAFKSMFSTKNM